MKLIYLVEVAHKPVSVNSAYPVSAVATHKTGERWKRLSKEAKELQEAIRVEIQRDYPKVTLKGALKVSYEFYFMDRRKRDVDNYIKVVQDGLVKGGLIEDDHLIVELTAKKGIGYPTDFIRIWVEEVENEKLFQVV